VKTLYSDYNETAIVIINCNKASVKSRIRKLVDVLPPEHVTIQYAENLLTVRHKQLACSLLKTNSLEHAFHRQTSETARDGINSPPHYSELEKGHGSLLKL
jgi:hypothetical protein